MSFWSTNDWEDTARICQVMVRVSSAQTPLMLKSSGLDGVFVRRYIPKDGIQIEEYSIVWLDKTDSLADALRKNGRIDASFGLACRRDGRQGIRVPQDAFAQMRFIILGSTADAEIRIETVFF